LKIVIVNGYVRENHGDAALISVLVKQLSQAFIRPEIVIASMENPIKRPIFDGCNNVGSLRLWSGDESTVRLDRIFRKLTVLLIRYLWVYLPLSLRSMTLSLLPKGTRGELAAVHDADLVVSVGGGYFNGHRGIGGYLHLWYVLLPLNIARHYKKVVVVAPQSFGPFAHSGQAKFVARGLNRYQMLFVREQISLDLLRKLGVDKNLIVPAVDSGFGYLKLPAELPELAPPKKPRIGITVRLWLNNAGQGQYESAIADFIIYAYQRLDASIVLIPEVATDYADDDDRLVGARIVKMTSAKEVSVEQMSKEQVLGSLENTYRNLDYIVGTRFHSVIFGLTSFVPALAIQYEHKTLGIMRQLGLEKWVIPIEQVTGQYLISLFDELIKSRDDYIKKLDHILPAYIAKTTEVPDKIKQLF
jgi:colanic acid/amylovoran biosynthesis protein